MELILFEIRAIEPIIRILNNVRSLASLFFRTDAAFLKNIVSTIINSPYLLISLCLVLIGFVIGILKRIISI